MIALLRSKELGGTGTAISCSSAVVATTLR